MGLADVWLCECARGFRIIVHAHASPEHLDQIVLNPTGLIRDRIRIFCSVLCTLEGFRLKLIQAHSRIHAKKQNVDI